MNKSTSEYLDAELIKMAKDLVRAMRKKPGCSRLKLLSWSILVSSRGASLMVRADNGNKIIENNIAL